MLQILRGWSRRSLGGQPLPGLPAGQLPLGPPPHIHPTLAQSPLPLQPCPAAELHYQCQILYKHRCPKRDQDRQKTNSGIKSFRGDKIYHCRPKQADLPTLSLMYTATVRALS